MTVRVLATKTAIEAARRELRRRKLSFVSPGPIRSLQRLKWMRGVSVGDPIKSWDVLNTAEFIQKHLPSQAPILDIGAYASEILCVLHRLNYTALTGADLNPELPQMPYADAIRYEVADFTRTPFADEAFAAVTAISVIEHGFQSQALLREVSRLLRPGGFFIASFDYWPDKIDTSRISIFGMDWRIFSKAEILDLLEEAQGFHLLPHGPLSLEAPVPLMNFAGKDYTFAWMALQKQGRHPAS